ncbi:MAG TPA: hypothetical protein VF755_20020, partial [Catenuloplanes sp.]
ADPHEVVPDGVEPDGVVPDDPAAPREPVPSTSVSRALRAPTDRFEVLRLPRRSPPPPAPDPS